MHISFGNRVVEADFAGGVGQQGSVVWEHGEVVLGPLVDRIGPLSPAKLAAGPINRALRRLGVQRSGSSKSRATPR
jgi:hypothetical protein